MTAFKELAELEATDSFVARHVAPSADEIAAMLTTRRRRLAR